MGLQAFPKSVIVVGAGVFGLSTALEISRKYPSTTVTVIDRLTPPVKDGTSIDTSRIIRPDYIDTPYEILADRARELLKYDPEVAPFYFEHGFTFVTDGHPGELNDLWGKMLRNLQEKHTKDRWKLHDSAEKVFQNLHGTAVSLAPDHQLPDKRGWNKGFTSTRCATINAEAVIKVYYDRARSRPNISFVLGTPVKRLLYGSNQDVLGVSLEDGQELTAEKTILATGAWSSRLVNLDGILRANAVSIAYIKLTDEEMAKYKSMGCHTHLGRGINIFTPIGSLLKVLRRTSGLVNTTDLPNPEDASTTYKASYPVTAVDQPGIGIPPQAERDIRDALREIFPDIADRPFERTRICWLEQTTNGDFLICPHPRFANLHMATGGSLHGWKFLPLIGEFVVDSINGTLPGVLKDKWSWESKKGAKLARLGFMLDGSTKEFMQEMQTKARI